ncbi:MAG: serine/threonine-protein phosphatase [Actinobacteria bacterium]|jgi:protein phosphatase|nr:serine/threonine-protein phosphatase [Actinomycetota bacterium]
MTLHLRYAARSDVGLVREGNEDSGYAGPALLLVADGMGGHAAGELASAIAVATVADLDVHPPVSSELLTALGDAINDVGDGIADVISADPDLTGMGTTVTGIYWREERIAVVHVGDSRAYLLRGGELSQITHDHTYVQTLVDAGRITEEEALIHPRRSLIMRALDGRNPVEADLSIREARDGDRYMLCTDGLSGVVRPDEMASILGDGEPTGCVTRLVDLALERGAPDNVTVVVADVVEVPDSAPDVPVVVEVFAPVVVGAAGEPRVRLRLPGVRFPDDAQPDPDRPEPPPPVSSGPPTEPQQMIDAEIVVPAAEAARRAAREEQEKRDRSLRRRRLWLTIAIIATAVVLLAATATMVARSWLSSQWYVAVNGSAGTGTVGVYQGIQGSLLGARLSTLWSDSGLQVGTLPYFDQELVSKGIPAAGEVDAQRIVAELQSRAADCQTIMPPAGCPGTAQ